MMNILREYFAGYFSVLLRGFCMGIADLIPGVSGGTVAFISGIYARLLSAISAFSTAALWQDALGFRWKAAWQRADGGFLCALFAGIGLAIFTAAGLLHYLLKAHAHLLLGFFCGLVLASAAVMFRQLKNFAPRHIAIGLLGLATAAAVVSLPDFSLTLSLPTFFIGGAIAISAMLLPGISGSYLLLIAGLYAPVIDALHERQWLIIIVFAAGCGLGLLCFARLLSAMLRRWHDGMLIFLIGVMLGAMPKLWPWKVPGAGIKTIMQPNISPANFSPDAQVWAVLLLFISGCALAVAADRIVRRQKNDNPVNHISDNSNPKTEPSNNNSDARIEPKD